MFNRKRTKDHLGYDLDLSKKRRTKEEHKVTGGVKRNDLIVVDNCPNCNIERQIKLSSSRKNKLCLKCFHNTPDMIRAKKNQVKFKSEQTKQRMKDNHWSKKGLQPWNKGESNIYSESTLKSISNSMSDHMSSLSESDKEDRYIKSSCTVRGISIKNFNGWATDESVRIRGSKVYKAWEQLILYRDNICQFPSCIERRKKELVAHHKDGFNWCIDKRFDIDNGVLLCKYHHTVGPKAFHRKYGNGDNTEQQYNEWLLDNTISDPTKKDIYIVTGAPGCGKSWVCNQLDMYNYIPYDDVPKEQHLHLMLHGDDRPIIYDPWRKATSFSKRYGDIFNIKLIVIVESESILKERLEGRGGIFNDKSIKYCKRANSIATKAAFSGSSDEVLAYLRSIVV